MVGRLSQHPSMTYLEGNLVCGQKTKRFLLLAAAAAAVAAVFIVVKQKLGARLRVPYTASPTSTAAVNRMIQEFVWDNG